MQQPPTEPWILFVLESLGSHEHGAAMSLPGSVHGSLLHSHLRGCWVLVKGFKLMLSYHNMETLFLTLDPFSGNLRK